MSSSEKAAAKPGFSAATTDGKTPANLLCFAALYENLLRFTTPLATQLPDRENVHIPVTLSTYVMDISGISMMQFWGLKNHIHTLAYLASAYYPETLGTIFIVGAPGFFGVVFGWIKGWLDPVTVAKIRIVDRGEVLSALEEVIDKASIPKAYGGELDYTFGNPPVVDPAVKDSITWNGEHSSFPLASLVWEPVVDSPDQVACWRVGRNNGEAVRECLCTIPKAWAPSAQKQE